MRLCMQMEPSNRRRRGGLLPLIALTIMAATALCTGALLGKRLSNTATPRAAPLRGGGVPSSPYVALCLTVASEPLLNAGCPASLVLSRQQCSNRLLSVVAANKTVVTATRLHLCCHRSADEHIDLPEWIEHHLGLGVGKIYVMDHASSPPLSTVLGEHIASGAVEYEWLPGMPPLPALPGPAPERPWDFTYNNGSYFQLFAYDRCLELHRQKHTWMGAQR